MTTEIYIQNLRADVSADISTLLTFELDNVKDFASRSTTWSKTIVLPGTANNNKLFGHIFQIGQANSYNPAVGNVGFNFNASKSADCIIFQDQLQAFKGMLRLLQINITKGQIEYEVAVFGELAGLNVALNSAFIDQLDFSAYDHTYNETNVINSWDNTPGSGYYYPLIDYGQVSADKHDWDIKAFRPALYVKEYVDKMFAAAGYRYSSDLFNTDRFKRLVIPNNQKGLFRLTNNFVNGSDPSNGPNFLLGQYVPDYEFTDYEFLAFSTLSVASNFTNTANRVFTYNQPGSINVRVRWHIVGTCFMNFGTPVPAIFGIMKNAVSIPAFQPSDFANYQFSPVPVATPTPFDISGDFNISVAENDTLQLAGLLQGGQDGQAYNFTVTEATLLIDSQYPTQVDVSIGDTVGLNFTIPTNIRQIDFLLSLVKLFNLYVYEDRFDNRLIYIKPYVDFYTTDSSDSVDWTYKLNRDKAIKIKPMSELTAKNYEFNYRQDSDYYNDSYRKKYNQGYGDYVFDSLFEFAEQKKTVDIIFSASPLLGYIGEEKVMPAIFKKSNDIEEKTDSNIRILQTKKVTGVTSWDILDGPGNVLASTTDYGYAGHFDDPDAPSNDINFGALRELLFTLVTGDLTRTQFNVYWSGYMAEITDKDSKLVTASFYLNPIDILNLDFSKFVFIDGILYRLNSIKDYNTSKPQDCEVQLLKINFLIY